MTAVVKYHIIVEDVAGNDTNAQAEAFANEFGLDAGLAGQILDSCPIVFLADAVKAEVKGLKPRLAELSNTGITFRVTTRDIESLPKVNWPIRPQFAVGGNTDTTGVGFDWSNNAFVCPCCGETFLFKRVGQLHLAEAPTIDAPAAPAAPSTDFPEAPEQVDAVEAAIEPEPVVEEAAVEEVVAEVEPEVVEEAPVEIDDDLALDDEEPIELEAAVEEIEEDEEGLELAEVEVAEVDEIGDALDAALDFDEPDVIEAEPLELADDEPIELEADVEELDLDDAVELEEADEDMDFDADSFELDESDMDIDEDMEVEDIEIEEADLGSADDAIELEPMDDGGAGEVAAAPVAVAQGEGEYNVFLSKISKKDKQAEAAVILAEIKGVPVDEAERLAGQLIIPVAKGVSEETANDILARFKAIKVSGRKTKKKK
jgi:hypothetical protein